MNLALVKTGESVSVSDLSGGKGFKSRVLAMGFTPDARVTMMQNHNRGPVIVYLRDSQVALGRGEAEKILVRRG